MLFMSPEWHQSVFEYAPGKAMPKSISPVSGRMATISLPLFSGLLASSSAAQVAAPEERPAGASQVAKQARRRVSRSAGKSISDEARALVLQSGSIMLK